MNTVSHLTVAPRAMPDKLALWSSSTPAGVVLFAQGTIFLLATMIAESVAPGYDMGAAAISDLGVIPATAKLFNGTLILVGLLALMAGRFLRVVDIRLWPTAVFAAAGLGSIGAGAFTLASNESVHSLFALLAFVGFNLVPLATMRLVQGPMRAIAILASMTGFAFLLLMVIGDSDSASAFGSIGHGGTERMIVYPAVVWMIALGGHLMRTVPGRMRADS